MQKLTNWRLARSGPWITIHGLGEDKFPTKITGVKLVESVDGKTVATRTDDSRVELA